MRQNWIVLSIGCVLMVGASSVGADDASSTRPNVLFIAIDDLLPELGCYGYNFMHTPRLDQFASEGRLFERHDVQVDDLKSRFPVINHPAVKE